MPTVYWKFAFCDQIKLHQHIQISTNKHKQTQKQQNWHRPAPTSSPTIDLGINVTLEIENIEFDKFEVLIKFVPYKPLIFWRCAAWLAQDTMLSDYGSPSSQFVFLFLFFLARIWQFSALKNTGSMQYELFHNHQIFFWKKKTNRFKRAQLINVVWFDFLWLQHTN